MSVANQSLEILVDREPLLSTREQVQEDISAAELWRRTGGLNDTVLDDLTTLQQPEDVLANLYGSVDPSIMEDFGYIGFSSVEQGASTYSADLPSAVHESLALTELPGFEGL
jgi:hypothetical protein